jgi:MinD-like ATPase involved in chromosome partitioning or flagellar assembly
MARELDAPRIVVASGMRGTGVSTLAAQLQANTPSLNIVDAGAMWTDILEACMPRFARFLAVTTDDIIAMASTYGLIKIVRDRFTGAQVELLVNRSDERDALKTYQRIQGAASHFLDETVAYGGAIPEDDLAAIHNIGVRLEEELGVETPSTYDHGIHGTRGGKSV